VRRAVTPLAAQARACIAYAYTVEFRLPWKSLAVAALVATSAAATFWLCRGLRHDDAFITFVYARHLGAGEGFVFNLGERVLGATSPLHVLLLALVYRVAGDVLPTAAIALGAAALSLQGLMLYSMARRFSPVLALLLGLLAWAGLAGGHTWLALETNLFVALVLATLRAHQLGHPLLCGLCLGLTILCRYDGVLLIPVLLIESRLQGRKFPRRELVVCFATVAPWLAAATLYFGSCLPQTLLAKRASSSFGEYLGHYLHHAAEQPLSMLFPALSPSVMFALALLGWASGILLMLRHLPELRAYLIFAVLLFLGYASIGPPPVQHWHMYPLILGSSVLLVLGSIGWLVRAAAWRGGFGGVHWRMLLPLVPGLVMLVLTGMHTLSWAAGIDQDYWLGQRHHRYETVAAWMKENLKPGQVFLAAEVGTLGYLTRDRMIDPYGLINDTNEYPVTQTPSALLRLVRRYRPTVVLIFPVFHGLWLEEQTDLRVVKKFAWNSLGAALLVNSPDVLQRPGHKALRGQDAPPSDGSPRSQ
jgi:hypothetical protein